MWRVRCPLALAAGIHIDQQAAVLDLDRIGGNAIVLEAGLTQAVAAVEFPVVPGADDIIAVESAVAERSADMVAGIRDRAELPILARYRQLAFARRDTLKRRFGKFFGAADVDPVFLSRHESAPYDLGRLHCRARNLHLIQHRA